MSNYASLKSAIQQVIKTNGNNEITGALLQQSLLSMINSLGVGYQFVGIATPSTNPGTPDARVMYLAYLPGTYVNFGGLAVTGFCVLKYNTAWTKEDIPISSSAGGDTDFLTEPDDLTLEAAGDTKILKFANRSYNSDNPNGMGYKILRADKTFAKQVTLANTIYEIRYDFDLGAASVTIPAGCTLKFVGGSLKNGNIIFNSTILINEKFVECSFVGNVVVSGMLKDENFCDISAITNDDTNFLTWIIEQAANNRVPLSIGRDYNIIIPRRRSEISLNFYLVWLIGKSFTLYGNGHTIYDNTNYGKNATYPLIIAQDCCKINIYDINYEGTNNSANSITENPSDVMSAGSGGADFLFLCGESKDINVYGLFVKKCHSGVSRGVSTSVPISSQYHNSFQHDNLTVQGLIGGHFDISAYDVRYAFECCKGSGLDVNVFAEYCSRACYLAGVENSRINVTGRFCTTPVLCLCKDAMSYTDDTYTTRVFTMCDNVDLRIEHLELTGNLTSYGFQDTPLAIQTYGKGTLPIDEEFNYRTVLYNSHISALIYEHETTNPNTIVFDGRNVADVFNIKLSGEFYGIRPSYVANAPYVPSSIIYHLFLQNCKCSNLYTTQNEDSTIMLIDSNISAVLNNSSNKCIPWAVVNSIISQNNSVSLSVIDENVLDLTTLTISSSEHLKSPSANSVYIFNDSNSKVIYTTPHELQVPLGGMKRIYFLNPLDNFAQVTISGFTMNIQGNTMQFPPKSLSVFVIWNIAGTYYSYLFRANSSGNYQYSLPVLTGGMGKGGFGFETTNRQVVYNYNGNIVNAFGRTAGSLRGATSSRPTLTANDVGYVYFDESLGKPVWYKGNNIWVDATGASV